VRFVRAAAWRRQTTSPERNDARQQPQQRDAQACAAGVLSAACSLCPSTSMPTLISRAQQCARAAISVLPPRAADVFRAMPAHSKELSDASRAQRSRRTMMRRARVTDYR